MIRPAQQGASCPRRGIFPPELVSTLKATYLLPDVRTRALRGGRRMSDSSNLSPNINLEFLRKDAKNLLKLCRAGDFGAIGRMRAQLPRLAALEDAQLRERIKLADVHHALARERGYANW